MAKKRKRPKPAKSVPRAPRPQVKRKVNKSEAIRELLRVDPRMQPSLIAMTLEERGITVSPQYVSMIKSKMKHHRANSELRTDEDVSISLEEVVAVRELLDRAGGVDQVERILRLIRILRS